MLKGIKMSETVLERLEKLKKRYKNCSCCDGSLLIKKQLK